MGVITSAVSDAVMAPNAAPMITATARSTTFPRRLKSRNPFSIVILPCIVISAVAARPRKSSAAFAHCHATRRKGACAAGLAGGGGWAELLHGQQEHDPGKDHQIGIEQDEDSGVVGTPFTAQATGCFCHAPRGYYEGQKLPMRTVQIVDVRESGQAQTGRECSQRKEHGA